MSRTSVRPIPCPPALVLKNGVNSCWLMAGVSGAPSFSMRSASGWVVVVIHTLPPAGPMASRAFLATLSKACRFGRSAAGPGRAAAGAGRGGAGRAAAAAPGGRSRPRSRRAGCCA
uniref:Uncharacterized protein n=1 Tax=Tanacetum cinerariifolium TaxID=118510 RepID=A0A699UIB8_TANCI|nr:hypothetical protein [Tanacetum cinerariifolium]